MTNFVFSINLKAFKSINYNGDDLYRRYSPIVAFMSSTVGEKYAQMLAQPYITQTMLKGSGDAKWSSTVFSKSAKPISSFPDNEKQKLLNEYQLILEPLQEYIETLEKSGSVDKKNWAKIIQSAFQTPGDEYIYYENGKFLLVLWGFLNQDIKKGNSSIHDKLKQKNQNKRDLNSRIKDSLKKKEEKQEVKKPVVTPVDKVEADKTVVEKEKEEKKEIVFNEPPNLIEDKKEEVTEENSYKEPEEKENQNDKVEGVVEESAETNTPPPEDNPPERNIEKEENNEKNNSRKKWLIIGGAAALAAIIAALLFFWPEPEYLPKQPNRVPDIDTTKINKDRDSVSNILTDRMNILLKGENTDMKTFARKFKDAFPDDEYQVTYYDTLTNRLQISIPSDKINTIKEELKQKIPEFEMLIWHESIFEHSYTPSDPGFSDPALSWYHRAVQVYNAWDYSKGDPSITIAVIDDGFDLTHPELAGRIVKPWNVPTHSTNVNIGIRSRHGTHVAGIAIGTANNGEGVSGIAPGCKFMPIQVGDQHGRMSNTAVIDGVLYAIQNGADVVNMSLGMSIDPRIAGLPQNEQQAYMDYLFKDEEAFWDEVFQMAYDKNIVFVLAGGNDNVLIGLDPMQRSNKTIKVSAIDPNIKKATFSNYGQKSTISAPGVQIYSSLPSNDFDFLDGTSMAAPVVAGAIALLKSINPAIGFDDLVDLIQSTGLPVSSPNAYVGNLIQLNKASEVLANIRRQQPVVNCPNMQARIDSLMQEIEKIRRQCPDSSAAGNDTLKIPKQPAPNDYAFAEGRWKSTTYLYNQNGEKVTLFFDFFVNGKGNITLVEPNNTQCVGKLNLSISNGKFVVDQTTNSICNPPPMEYMEYRFECVADNSGNAQCVAQSKVNPSNKFQFTLIKINN